MKLETILTSRLNACAYFFGINGKKYVGIFLMLNAQGPWVRVVVHHQSHRALSERGVTVECPSSVCQVTSDWRQVTVECPSSDLRVMSNDLWVTSGWRWVTIDGHSMSVGGHSTVTPRSLNVTRWSLYTWYSMGLGVYNSGVQWWHPRRSDNDFPIEAKHLFPYVCIRFTKSFLKKLFAPSRVSTFFNFFIDNVRKLFVNPIQK